MEAPRINQIDYNSTYISMNLIDELDYYLGGYAKPNAEFIFSLNTFVESFIACSGFYTSLTELNHINLTSGALFPHGRPILNMIVKETGLRFVDGVVEKTAKTIYSDYDQLLTRKEAHQKFIAKLDKLELEQFLLKSNILLTPEFIPLMTSTFENGEFSVFELHSTSSELVSNLLNVSHHNSIQTTLPIYLFNKQVNELTKTPYSIQALENVAKIFDEKIDNLKKSLGYKYLPIPPFTNILLSQLRSIADIPAKLTQLRADYQELRTQFVELERNIYGTESIKEQSDAYYKFTEFWTVFNKKYLNKNNRIFYGALDLGQGIDADKSVDTFIDKKSPAEAFTDLNMGKLGVNLVKGAYNWHQDRKVIKRFKGLTNIWELFENSTNLTQQLGNFERLFRIKFTDAEISAVRHFIQNHFTDISSIQSP